MNEPTAMTRKTRGGLEGKGRYKKAMQIERKNQDLDKFMKKKYNYLTGRWET